MDAAYKLMTKTVLFLAAALLLAVPGSAQQLIVSSSTVALSTDQAQQVDVTASGTNPLTYNISGVPFWLRVTSLKNGTVLNNITTPDTLFFQLGNSNCGSCTATVV